MNVSLSGQVALVSGAASPIGRAIAVRLAGLGVSLVLADVVEDAVHSFAGNLPGTPQVVIGDLSDNEVALRFINVAREVFGRLDILVNNAGGGIIRPFLEHTPETLRTTIDRNLWTCLWCCRAALPVMLTQNYGRIVNIGADSVRNGLLDHAGYNAAKGGVHGLTTGLAREFASYDITVNTVAPCMVNTPYVAEELARKNPFIEKFLTVIPKGRPGGLDEIASMVTYLALPEAAFVTGQVISVNGGSTML